MFEVTATKRYSNRWTLLAGNENTVFNVRTGSNTITVREGGSPTGTARIIPQFLSPIGILGPRIVRFNLTYKFGR